jgi:hypothetical protein
MGSRVQQSNPRPTHDELVRRPLRLSVSYNPDAYGTWHGCSMTSESRHISEWIDRRADEVYGYASDPANLPQWAPGLGRSVEKIDERWFVETSEGRVGFAFVQRNEHSVLDHYVTMPSGEVVYNPMRVIADGSGCEVVFTVRRRPGMSDEDFTADAEAVAADLTRLKRVLEGR